MGVVRLTDDETVAIFANRSLSSIRNLDKTDGKQVLKRLITTLESSAPDRFIEKRFTGCEELEQLRAGSYLRIYCRLVESVPKYNVLFIFGITPHRYRNLTRYDEQARRRVREITQRTTDEAVQTYIDANDALTANDLRGNLNEMWIDAGIIPYDCLASVERNADIRARCLALRTAVPNDDHAERTEPRRSRRSPASTTETDLTKAKIYDIEAVMGEPSLGVAMELSRATLGGAVCA